MNDIGSDCIIIWPFPDPCPFNGVCINRLHLYLGLNKSRHILSKKFISALACVMRDGKALEFYSRFMKVRTASIQVMELIHPI